jgi:hypothetical protein
MITYKLAVRHIFGLASLLVLSSSSFAQKWEIGAGIGVCQYKGDIMPSYKPFVARPGGSAFIRMNVNRSVSFKVQGLYGLVTGNDKFIKSDPFHQSRGYSFNATIMEWGGQVEYNFLNFRTTASRIVNNWTPYVFGGYGGAWVSTKAQFNSTGSPFFPTKSSPSFLSLGIGFKKEWRPQWNWSVELGARWLNNDFLDATGYYSNGTYSNNTSTVPLFFPYKFQKFTTPLTKVNDMYYYTNFSISYIFYKVHCPTRR